MCWLMNSCNVKHHANMRLWIHWCSTVNASSKPPAGPCACGPTAGRTKDGVHQTAGVAMCRQQHFTCAHVVCSTLFAGLELAVNQIVT